LITHGLIALSRENSKEAKPSEAWLGGITRVGAAEKAQHLQGPPLLHLPSRMSSSCQGLPHSPPTAPSILPFSQVAPG